MRYSRFFLHTLKEAPADAELISHRLMVRTGMIRKLAAGIYSYLPYGLLAIRKFEAIVRDEMLKAGAQELLMPAIQPAELWQESGRWPVYGRELLRIQDRHERDFCFGPTHEEVITDICRQEIRSYRDLPQNLFQIQSKFRDEVRPRFGLMRGREFIMKDGYSFHVDAEDARKTYWQMYDVYERIFRRCGLEFRPVEAVTGNIGGSLSHEFQVLAESGESLILACDTCEYAANEEKALFGVDQDAANENQNDSKKEKKIDSIPPPSEVSTPNVKTVEEVTEFLNVESHELIKTLIFWTPAGFVAACVRGDHDLNEFRLQDLLEVSELRLATADETETVTGAPVGFAGPVKLSCPIYYDYALERSLAYVAGGNRADTHFRNVVPGRDFAGTASDLRMARPGDLCPKECKGHLRSFRGIEVGQVFYLGKKYSEALKAFYLNQEGREVAMEMGCYGIGIGRTIAASIEQNHDDQGIVFPMALAPFQVVLVSLAAGDEAVRGKADEFYHQFQAAGIEVLYDDRDSRAGVKFKDADLIGIPLQVVLGKKGYQKEIVELKWRKSGENEEVSFSKIVSVLQEKIRSALPDAT